MQLQFCFSKIKKGKIYSNTVFYLSETSCSWNDMNILAIRLWYNWKVNFEYLNTFSDTHMYVWQHLCPQMGELMNINLLAVTLILVDTKIRLIGWPWMTLTLGVLCRTPTVIIKKRKILKTLLIICVYTLLQKTLQSCYALLCVQYILLFKVMRQIFHSNWHYLVKLEEITIVINQCNKL